MSAQPTAADRTMSVEMTAVLPNGREIKRTCVTDSYHGTSLYEPDVVFRSGIPKKGNDRRLLEHVLGNPTSAFRGTTVSPVVSPCGQGATFWAGVDGWVYLLEALPSWNVEKELQGQVPRPGGFGDCPMQAEVEHAVPSRIEAGRVVRAGKVHPGRVVEGNQMLLVKSWIRNPYR